MFCGASVCMSISSRDLFSKPPQSLVELVLGLLLSMEVDDVDEPPVIFF